ncbi:Hsp20/alpha crystallin family protein [Candidatus Wolfebacteria bacterium]|nr:Hsp20/alpha crystallin family protein [Candidatus Wolfebacteria bacterium]
MNDESKNFFEKLAGIRGDDEEFEPKIAEADSDDEVFEDAEGQLAIDVYQTQNSFIIESTIAGVNPDDIDVSISPDSVNIKGKREKEEKVKDQDYLCQECYWGRFSRSVILPEEIDPDRSQAIIKNGLLKITLPKANKKKTKKLKIKID